MKLGEKKGNESERDRERMVESMNMNENEGDQKWKRGKTEDL